MKRRKHRGIWHVLLTATILTSLALACPSAAIAQADESSPPGSSLELVPADAAFYGALLRNREQIEILLQSNAWAKLAEMPAIRDALDQFSEEAAKEGTPAAQFDAARKNPALQEALKTLADILGDEVFVFVDDEAVGTLELIQELFATVRRGQMMADVAGGTGRELRDEDRTERLVLNTLLEHENQIKFPNKVIGFKVTDKERMKTQLDGLAGIFALFTMAVPELNGSFKRAQVDGTEFLTLSLNGKMIPWDQVPLDGLREAEANPGDADKVIDKLKALKLVIAIGLRDDYLLLSFGPSTDVLAGLGKGDVLAGRPEFKPLKKHAKRRLTSIGYMSGPMATTLAGNRRQIDDMLDLLDSVLPYTDVPKADQARIRKDAEALAKDLRKLVPEQRANMGFCYLTRSGYEGFTYDWSDHSRLDSTRPLELLNHAGGRPLAAAVVREAYRPEDYDLMVKWLEIAYGYFDQYAVPQMPPDEREKFRRFADEAGPIAGRLDRVNRELLMPSLADCHWSLVLDADLKVTKICKEVPELKEPVPMLEAALVAATRDADKLREACDEYRKAFNDVVDILHGMEPDEVPDFEVPVPQIKEADGASYYFYPLPAEWGLDKRIQPTFALSDTVAVWCLSRRHAKSLLADKPLAAGEPLADASRPRALAAVCDWAGMVQAATPWVDLAAKEALKKEMGPPAGRTDEQKAKAVEILGQVHTVLDVLQALRTVTCEGYVEGDAMVTHSVTVIRDVE